MISEPAFFIGVLFLNPQINMVYHQQPIPVRNDVVAAGQIGCRAIRPIDGLASPG